MQPDPDLTRFLSEIARLPLLPRKEEAALVELAREGNEDAGRKLVAHNLRFVVTVAKRHRGLGLPFKDLVNEGCIGMMKAVTRFDPSTGNKFVSYAVWWIRQAIVTAIHEKAKVIRTSVEHDAPLRRLRKAPLRQVIGGMYLEDVDGESEKTRIRPEYLTASLNASKGGLGLDKPLTHEGLTPAEITPSPAPQPDELTEQRERVDILNRLRGKLTPQQREIITLCFGLDGGAPTPMSDIARQLGFSPQRIQQIKGDALAKMRKMGQRYDDKKCAGAKLKGKLTVNEAKYQAFSKAIEHSDKMHKKFPKRPGETVSDYSLSVFLEKKDHFIAGGFIPAAFVVDLAKDLKAARGRIYGAQSPNAPG